MYRGRCGCGQWRVTECTWRPRKRSIAEKWHTSPWHPPRLKSYPAVGTAPVSSGVCRKLHIMVTSTLIKEPWLRNTVFQSVLESNVSVSPSFRELERLYRLTAHTVFLGGQVLGSGEVVTVGSDGSVMVWDRQDGVLLADLPASCKPITTVTASSNDAALVTAGEDGIIKVNTHRQSLVTHRITETSPNFLHSSSSAALLLFFSLFLLLINYFSGRSSSSCFPGLHHSSSWLKFFWVTCLLVSSTYLPKSFIPWCFLLF